MLVESDLVWLCLFWGKLGKLSLVRTESINVIFGFRRFIRLFIMLILLDWMSFGYVWVRLDKVCLVRTG